LPYQQWSQVWTAKSILDLAEVQCLVVVEPETMQIETFKNPYLEESSGRTVADEQTVLGWGTG